MSLLQNTMAKSGTANFYNGVATTSLRLAHQDDSYLTFTRFCWNRRKFTLSLWFKMSGPTIGGQSSNNYSRRLFSVFAGATPNDDELHFLLRLEADDLDIGEYAGGGNSNFRHRTDRKFRDVSAWYHLVYAFDSTQATEANRVKLYINGVQETSFSQADYPSEDFDTTVSNTVEHIIGDRAYAIMEYDGYICRYEMVNGSQLTPSSFGELKNGVWIAKKYTGAYGTNGFRLKFDQVGVGTASTSTIGADTSGNTNHFTSSGIVASDCAMPDSPENNFATINSVMRANITLSEGNLKMVWC